jgi:hypothetical protein
VKEKLIERVCVFERQTLRRRERIFDKHKDVQRTRVKGIGVKSVRVYEREREIVIEIRPMGKIHGFVNV